MKYHLVRPAGFHPQGLLNPQPLPDAKISTTITFPKGIVRKAEDALVRRDFAMILENSDLSKYLYFKAIQQSQLPKEPSFQVTSVENTLKVETDQTTLEQVETQIELIRKIFQKYLSSQEGFTLIASTAEESFLLYSSEIEKAPEITCIIEKNVEALRLFKMCEINLCDPKDESIFHTLLNDHPLLPKQQYSIFKNIISPALKSFASQLNTSCAKPSKDVSSLLKGSSFFSIKNSYEFIWPKKPIQTYPITPLKSSHSQDFQQTAYALYKEGKQCDLTLQTGEEKIAFHSLVLHINRVEVMQTMLTGPMKEAQEKCIIMDDFSLDTLKTFVDYLYLGPKILEPETFFEKEHNLEELFALAHQYQIQPLLDCCTNLLTLTYTPDQVEELTKITNLYDNSQLNTLAEHYRKNSPKQEETE